MKKNLPNIDLVKAKLKACRHHDLQCLSELKVLLEGVFHENEINALISYRVKDADSVVYKIKKKQCEFHEIYDRLGMRIIVKSISDCYKVLELCKQKFPFKPQSLKDYIAKPKENGYQSLHLLINPPCGHQHQDVEVQIRTWSMQYECLAGGASHRKYKIQKYNSSTKSKLKNRE